MPILRVIRMLLLTLVGSAVAAGTLFISVMQLGRAPRFDKALLGGLIPITVRKWPWAILIAVVLLLAWLAFRRTARQYGLGRGIRIWALQLGMSWSLAALLLLVGVFLYGIRTRSLADLNWPFTVGSLASVAVVLVGCSLGWRSHRAAPDPTIGT